MSDRPQPRHIARELALLSLSQISRKSEKIAQQELSGLVLAAIRTLKTEVQEALDSATAEVQRSNEQLLSSEIRTTNLESARAMVQDAIEFSQTAINRLGIVIDFPEIVQSANQHEVRTYAIDILSTVNRRRAEIDQQIEEALVDWQLKRLPKIDRDILRIAVADIMFLEIPKQVAINEAVELAKRYSDEEGHRFINGVMRRVSNNLKSQSYELP